MADQLDKLYSFSGSRHSIERIYSYASIEWRATRKMMMKINKDPDDVLYVNYASNALFPFAGFVYCIQTAEDIVKLLSPSV